MITLSRGVFWSLALLVIGCASALAQGRTDAIDSASLAALTSEVRQLRIAVEELTRSQTQTQALGVYLSVQQSRILQVATRLDAVRKDLDGLTTRNRALATSLASMQAELPQIADPERRAALEEANREIRAEQQRIAAQEDQARLRESELSQALRSEETRWSDLIGRLEQLIKK